MWRTGLSGCRRAQRRDRCAVEERSRAALARVAERPQAAPVARRNRHLDRVLDPFSRPVSREPDGALHGAWRIVLEADVQAGEEELESVVPSISAIQRRVGREREGALDRVEFADHAVVHPEPAPCGRDGSRLLDRRRRSTRGCGRRRAAIATCARQVPRGCGRSTPARCCGRRPACRRAVHDRSRRRSSSRRRLECRLWSISECRLEQELLVSTASPSCKPYSARSSSCPRMYRPTADIVPSGDRSRSSVPRAILRRLVARCDRRPAAPPTRRVPCLSGGIPPRSRRRGRRGLLLQARQQPLEIPDEHVGHVVREPEADDDA